MTERIFFITLGSRGDVQPYIAVANRLIQAGHEVGIATNAIFESFVAQNGLGISFFPMEGDPAALLQSKEFEEIFFSGDLQKQVAFLFEETKKHSKANLALVHQYFHEFKPTCIIGGIINIGEALALGHKYLLPVICATTVPVYPSESLPLIGLTEKPLAFGWLNKTAGRLLWKLQWLTLGEAINEMRTKTLKIPKMDSCGFDYVPVLQMFSPTVVPRPADYPPHVVDTSYWILPPTETFEPDETIRTFLENGTPPVYIGFGSMPVKDKQDVLNKFSEALEKTGQRGIYCGGWSKLDSLTSDNILIIPGAPHEWLLPQCAMAFHHGGAGTTAASLRAGIPTIILPVLVDQPFW
eukprot:CAMPEP_0117069646 /NCGR_PEP_ID=MMETSP0472-20121206/48868_1 /TAXON_ID=693140 ORGANISM="Tiarina fusus, Strain LIS" /NCGR_SAMPLE_ID=MMETSP0472 /ASSEMBLY_ACC=CAM_ASM_000603 /LENGTH=352 /DNA_ID=CAMNT_0004792307 /DNA_START=17 /DNA_END=1072 /DNA_ORIENTATION=-